MIVEIDVGRQIQGTPLREEAGKTERRDWKIHPSDQGSTFANPSDEQWKERVGRLQIKFPLTMLCFEADTHMEDAAWLSLSPSS